MISKNFRSRFFCIKKYFLRVYVSTGFKKFILKIQCSFYFPGSSSNNESFCSSNKIIESINISPGVSPPVICYACHLNDMPGKFYNDKAVALGIPSGPQRQDLTDGKTITLENGLQVNCQFCSSS